MKVKDLIEALESCNPDAEVCIEANDDCLAHKVVEYSPLSNDKTPSRDYLYICDNEEYLDEVMLPSVKRTIYSEIDLEESEEY